MAQPAFGLLLQHLREEKGLSLRDLAKLAEIDHAYIYRLEAGDKESPSDEVSVETDPRTESRQARSGHASVSGTARGNRRRARDACARGPHNYL